MKELEVERYADNGAYSHSEIINADTGEFISYICSICGTRWINEEYEHETCT